MNFKTDSRNNFVDAKRLNDIYQKFKRVTELPITRKITKKMFSQLMNFNYEIKSKYKET